jgi:hypothetical protein
LTIVSTFLIFIVQEDSNKLIEHAGDMLVTFATAVSPHATYVATSLMAVVTSLQRLVSKKELNTAE